MSTLESAGAFEASPEAASPGFSQRFVGMLFQPRATMQDLVETDAWVGPAIMLLLGHTIYYLPIALGIADFMSSAMLQVLRSPSVRTTGPPDAFVRGFSGAMWAVPLFASLWQVHLTAATSWAIRTAIFYFLARSAGGGRAPWWRVFSLVGWAWIPLFFQYLLIGIGILALPGLFGYFVPLPDVSQFTDSDPAAVSSGTSSLVQVLLLFNPLVIWNLLLCTVGLADLFRLPRWKSALIVFVPTLLQVLLVAGLYLYSEMVSATMAPGDTGTGAQ